MISIHKAPAFILLPICLAFILSLSSIAAASTIEGFVFDQARNPLADVDIELLNENRQLRERTRTNGIGRYQFTNLADGRYYIKVLPFRLGFQDKEQEVEINSFSIRGAGIGNETRQSDFYLELKQGSLADTTTGVVFVQKVPEKAEQLYKESQKAFEDKNEQLGFDKLIGSVKEFPQYYAALNDLGKRLLVRKRYLDAASMFVRAVEANPKSSKSFYYMGLSFGNAGKDYLKAAGVAFAEAANLAPNSFEIPFEQGKLEKQLGNFTNAETFFIKANKLSEKKHPEVHMWLAQLYSDDLKDYAKAADELEMYIKLTKDDKLKKKVAELRAKASGKS
jgi:tetratricopeptide (TPR) repeat protein